MTTRTWILSAAVAAAVAAHFVLFHVGLRSLSLGVPAAVLGVVLVAHRPLVGAVLRRVRGKPKA